MENNLKQKLAEHEAVVKQLENDMEKLRLEMIELQKDPSKKKELVMATMARVTLEMKKAFHNGAVAFGKDVLGE